MSMITNARCPVCHKKMEMYGSGDKKSFVCVCGYRENEEAFIKRTKGSANAASKSYAREYMRRQNSKEEQGESAFAKALREAMEKKK